MQDFRDDLKAVYTLAGVKGLNTVFLLTDSDIVKVGVYVRVVRIYQVFVCLHVFSLCVVIKVNKSILLYQTGHPCHVVI